MLSHVVTDNPGVRAGWSAAPEGPLQTRTPALRAATVRLSAEQVSAVRSGGLTAIARSQTPKPVISGSQSYARR
jgi:hypothetical protein